MTQKRAHLVVEGRVQGVYFRQSMLEVAIANGVFGWVRNLSSGEVEAVIEGEESAVDRVIDWSRTGPSRAHVDQVSVEWLKPVGGSGSFKING
ncbi:MAG: acylphosphatase [Rubrobacteridae bacterium]|nr:acylphosphatase [Rubrobacteridae bacterium]